MKAEDLEPMLDDYFIKFGDIDPSPSHWRRYVLAQMVSRGHVGLSYLTNQRLALLFEARVQKMFAVEGIALAKGKHADVLPLGEMAPLGDRKQDEPLCGGRHELNPMSSVLPSVGSMPVREDAGGVGGEGAGFFAACGSQRL